MNNSQRQELQFDDAAIQAKSAEGVSSFGKVKYSTKKAEQYAQAAEVRGVNFRIDEFGTWLFEERE